MGNSGLPQSGMLLPPDTRTYLQNDIPKFIYQGKLGNGKFLKSYHVKVDGSPAVVKVYMRLPNEDLSLIASKLSHIWNKLCPSKYPNLLPYQMWLQTNTKLNKSILLPSYLIRQFLMSSLYGRLSTRPFLNNLEIMKCVEDCHNEGVIHGDITPDNIMVTSWNWVILTDFANLKPNRIPEDDPAEFQYYFDATDKRRCYFAPERFYRRCMSESIMSDQDRSADPLRELEASTLNYAATVTNSTGIGTRFNIEGDLAESSDLFSLGCTIAEIFLNGQPFLDLPSVLKYRSCYFTPSLSDNNSNTSPSGSVENIDLDGPNSPALSVLARITDERIRNAVCRMTRRLPERRPASVTAELLLLEEQEVFPAYFRCTLHDFFKQLQCQCLTPDDRIGLLCKNFQSLMESAVGVIDDHGTQFFTSISCKEYGVENIGFEKPGIVQDPLLSVNSQEHLKNTKDAPPSIRNLVAQVEAFIKSVQEQGSCPNPVPMSDDGPSSSRPSKSLSPTLDALSAATASTRKSKQSELCGAILLVQIICSSLQHLKKPASKVLSLLLLLRFGMHCADEIILQRIVPSIVLVLEDPLAYVRAIALRCLRSILSGVEIVSTLESSYFSQYIFPALASSAKDSEVTVRMAFAESIAILAESSRRFLEMSHHILLCRSLGKSNKLSSFSDKIVIGKAVNDKDVVSVENSYERLLSNLHHQVARWVRDLTVDAMSTGDMMQTTRQSMIASTVKVPVQHHNISLLKRLLLVDVIRLCRFFGPEATVDLLLPQLLTFLNDQDWELRVLFCSKISDVCVFVGMAATTLCVLPCLGTALVDVEEKVVAEAVDALRRLIDLQLMSNHLITEVVKDTAPLLLHPSKAVRTNVLELFEHASNCLGYTDAQVLILPTLRPMLRLNILGVPLTAQHIGLATVTPLSRLAFQKALQECRRSTTENNSNPDALPASNSSTANICSTFDSTTDNEIVDLSKTVRGHSTRLSYLQETDDDDNNNSDRNNTKGSRLLDTLDALESDGYNIYDEHDEERQNTLTDNSVSVSVAGGTEKRSEIDELTNKLKILQPYLMRVSKEADRGSQHRYLSQREYYPLSQSYTSSLNYQCLDSTVQTLLVPHQKHCCPLPSLPSEKVEFALQFSRTDGTAGNSPISSATIKTLSTVVTVPNTMTSNSSSRKHQSPPSANSSTSDELAVDKLNVKLAGALFGCVSGLAGSDSTLLSDQLSPESGGPYKPTAVSASSGTSITSSTKLRLPLPVLDPVVFSNTANLTTPNVSVASQKLNIQRQLNDEEETATLLTKLRALQVPPLPLDFGTLRHPDGRYYSVHTESLDCSGAIDGSSRNIAWRPREGGLIATLVEHTRSVNRVAVAADQSFFVSASSDCRAKIWQLSGLDKVAFPRSVLTYKGHTSRLNDAVVMENSHSVASCSDDGTVHIWRVDAGANATLTPNNSGVVPRGSGLSVSGMSAIRSLDSSEGPVVAVAHFNGSVSSCLVYGSLQGGVHGWDLRAAREAFCFSSRPELGHMTAMTLAPDRTWICFGTSRGFVALWDIRFNIFCKLWKLSSTNGPIHRLACCKSFSSVKYNQDGDGTFLFIAAGKAEAAVWSLPDGNECIKCFRSIPIATSRAPLAPLPCLVEVDIKNHPGSVVKEALSGMTNSGSTDQVSGRGGGGVSMDNSIRALVGRISPTGPGHLITAGTDRQIRFWDFSSPEKCFTVAGLDPGQPRPSYDFPTAVNLGPNITAGKLVVCFDACLPSVDVLVESQRPLREGKGPVPPSTGFKDAVLDLKCVDLPMRMMISCSRDCTIKLWR